MSAWYLDASAIVKFAVEERESGVLNEWRAALDVDNVLVTSELSIAEVLRAVRRVGADVPTALTHLDALDHVAMDRDLMLAASALEPAELRTLDAIHLASAAALGDELVGIVTYDERLAAGARRLGVPAIAPA